MECKVIGISWRVYKETPYVRFIAGTKGENTVGYDTKEYKITKECAERMKQENVLFKWINVFFDQYGRICEYEPAKDSDA